MIWRGKHPYFWFNTHIQALPGSPVQSASKSRTSDTIQIDDLAGRACLRHQVDRCRGAVIIKIYHLGCPPSQDSSHKWRFRLGFPTKNGIILVVTVTGPNGSKYFTNRSISLKCSGISLTIHPPFGGPKLVWGRYNLTRFINISQDPTILTEIWKHFIGRCQRRLIGW